MSVSVQDIPTKTDKGKFEQIAFRPKTTSEGKETGYVFIQPDDLDHIMYWLQRFLSESASRSIQEETMWEMFNTKNGMPDLSLPKSSYFSKPENSIISYVGGILSNHYRSNADLNKNQLKKITEVWNKLIAPLFNSSWTPGYNYITKTDIQPPKRISFKIH